MHLELYMRHKPRCPEAQRVVESIKAEQDADSEGVATAKELSARNCLILLGAFFATFCTAGYTNSFGILQDFYHQHQLSNKSQSEIAWIGSFQGFAIFAGAAPAGILVDKIGPQIPVMVGGICMLVSVFMTSLCTRYYQLFLAQGVLSGFSMSFLAIPTMVTVAKSFEKNRGLATGITIAGSSVGGIIWPIMLDRFINNYGVSFGWTMRIIGFTMLPLIAVVCVTTRLPREPRDEGKSLAEGSDTGKRHKTDLSIVKKPVFIVFCTALAFYNLGFFSPFFFVTSYAGKLGMSPTFSFYLVAVLNGASLVGRITMGFGADRYGPFNLSVISAITSTIVAFCWTRATSVAGLAIWTLAYGFTSGAILSLQVACCANLSTKETHGTAIGLALGSAAITGLIGTPISGVLIPHGYLALSMFAGATLAVGAILMCCTRLLQSRTLIMKL